MNPPGTGDPAAPGPPGPDAETSIRELVHDPRIRSLLGDVLADELAARREPSLWRRLQPWVAGAASAFVTLLAFFLPSLQDQWDRYESRQVIQRYVDLGRDFMQEGRYELAEQTFARAFELSENKRLDVEEERLAAKVEQVNSDPEWGRKNPEGIDESDFLYLLHFQKAPGRARQRAATLNSYGVFLSGEHRAREAEVSFREAIHLDSTNSTAWVNLGNLLSDRGHMTGAEAAYRRALALDSLDARAAYDLGLLLAQSGRGAEAEAALRRAVTLDPRDRESLGALAEALEKNGRRAEAAATRARLAALPPEPPRPVRRKPRAPGDAGE